MKILKNKNLQLIYGGNVSKKIKTFKFSGGASGGGGFSGSW